MAVCTGLCGVSVLLLIIASGLTAAGMATNYWYENGDSHSGLYNGFSLEDNNDDDWFLGVRSCMIIALGLSLICFITYFCVCCCQENCGRSGLLCTQLLLVLMAATAAAAGIVVTAWRKDWNNEFGYSYFMAAAGAVFYVLTAVMVLSDFCCGRRRDY